MSRPKISLFSLAILFLLASCTKTTSLTKTASPTTTAEGDNLAFETIAQTQLDEWGIYFDSSDPNIVIISSPQEISRIVGTNSDAPVLLLESVDFDHYFVVFVNRGLMSTIGYITTIDLITRSNDIVHVYVTFTDPKPDQPVGAMVSNAFHLVQVEKTGEWNRDIRFDLIAENQVLTSVNQFIPSAGVSIPFTTITQVDFPNAGDLYESHLPGMIIVSRVEDIDSLGRYIGEESVRQLQTLDYSRYFALAAFQGYKPGTAYNITVTRLEWEGDTVNVYASFIEPKPNEASGATVTSPFHLIKVNKGSKWGKDITFNLFSGDILVASVKHAIP